MIDRPAYILIYLHIMYSNMVLTFVVNSIVHMVLISSHGSQLCSYPNNMLIYISIMYM